MAVESIHAPVMELVDNSVLETEVERRVGSSPTRSTFMPSWRNGIREDLTDIPYTGIDENEFKDEISCHIR